MKINENYSVSKDSYNWILTFCSEGDINPKTGSPTVTTKITYHPTLEQVLNKFIDEAADGDDMLQILHQIKEARKDIADFCKSMKS